MFMQLLCMKPVLRLHLFKSLGGLLGRLFSFRYPPRKKAISFTFRLKQGFKLPGILRSPLSLGETRGKTLAFFLFSSESFF